MDKTIADIMEQDAAPRSDKLDKVRDAVRRCRDIQAEIRDMEELLKERKKVLLKITQRDLVDVFDDANITDIGVPREGNQPAFRAVLKPFYHANIAADWPDDRRGAAFGWLDENGHGDIIKDTIVVEFPRGSRERQRLLADWLDKNKMSYSQTLAVPWNTLTSLIKTLTEKMRVAQADGEEVTPLPLETLGATVGRVVEVKPVKED